MHSGNSVAVGDETPGGQLETLPVRELRLQHSVEQVRSHVKPT